MTVKCNLVVGDTVKDKSDLILFFGCTLNLGFLWYIASSAFWLCLWIWITPSLVQLTVLL